MLSRIPRRTLARPAPSLMRAAAAVRQYSASQKRPVDEKVDELAELYATAKDEFEIAVEETEKNTIYAREDRETAREELDKFKAAYDEAISTSTDEDGSEIKKRVGQRFRELDNAVTSLSQADQEEH